ncbi:unnamed protein product, partial [Meganyctiphanes norvegica]
MDLFTPELIDFDHSITDAKRFEHSASDETPVGTTAMSDIDRELTPILAELMALEPGNVHHPTARKLSNWLMDSQRTVEEFMYVIGPLWNHNLWRLSIIRLNIGGLWPPNDLSMAQRANQVSMGGRKSARRRYKNESPNVLNVYFAIYSSERGIIFRALAQRASQSQRASQRLFQQKLECDINRHFHSESGKWELEGELRDLEDRVASLEAEVRRLEAWKRQVVRRTEERREVQMTLFTEEIDCLERSEKQYQVLIETLLASRNS